MFVLFFLDFIVSVLIFYYIIKEYGAKAMWITVIYTIIQDLFGILKTIINMG